MKGAMAEISVIIPVYKVEAYLSRCLDSVLTQTFQDFEVICVNDGSPDNCGNILADYAAKHAHIKIITQANQGLSMARNNGLKQATGKYIYFLDSDDAIHPQLLETVYTYAERFQADLVSFEYEENQGTPLFPKLFNVEHLDYKLSNNPVLLGSTKEKYHISYNVWTKLYKKTLLDKIEFISGIHFEDFPHTFAVLAKRPKTVVLSQVLHYYTLSNDSLSRATATPQQICDYHTGIKAIYDIYKTPELAEELKFLRYSFIPNILKHQLGRCKRAHKEVQGLMYEAFAEELRDLDAKGLICWRGHKLTRYLTYKKLIKKGML